MRGGAAAGCGARSPAPRLTPCARAAARPPTRRPDTLPQRDASAEPLTAGGDAGGGGCGAGEGDGPAYDPAELTKGAPSRHLWLGNLHQRLPRSLLRSTFERFGPVEDVVTFPGRMYAFVNFREPADAARAARAVQVRRRAPGGAARPQSGAALGPQPRLDLGTAP